MTTKQHTPTPWILTANGQGIKNIEHDEMVCFFEIDEHERQLNNPQHVIDCVNQHETLKAKAALVDEAIKYVNEMLCHVDCLENELGRELQGFGDVEEFLQKAKSVMEGE